MIIKQRVKLTKVNEDGTKKNFTIVVCGRTPEELLGRVEKNVNRYLQKGYLLR